MEKPPASEETTIALVNQKVDFLLKEVEEIKLKLEQQYVSQDQFLPVRNVVYGLVTLILVGVVGALIALVIK